MDDHDDDDSSSRRRSRRFFDFDCPTCSANNPMDDGFRNGDEIRCYYCSMDFQVRVTEDGGLKLREI